MTSPTSRRDAAERFALLLEERDPATSATAEQQALASLAAALTEMPVPSPPMRSEARGDLRTAVLQAAREQRAEPPLLTRLRDGARRLRYSTAAVTGAGATAMALSGGGVALAAEQAGPDDALYDVKLTLEDLRLALTFDEVARGDRAMSYALDRLDEAHAVAETGNDTAAAEALRGATDRTRRGSELLLGSGLVDPVRGLAQDLATEVGLVEALRPLLGEEGNAAADELIAAIIVATEGVLEMVDVDELPAGIPILPNLPVPQQSDEPTPEPSPTVTATEVQTSDGSPTPTPVPTVGEGLPLPVPLPSLPDPIQELGDDLLDGVEEVQPGATGSIGAGVGGPVEGVTGGLVNVIEETGGTVDDLGDSMEETLDAVMDPVQSALPEPLGDAVQEVPGTVDDVIDVVPGLLDPLDGIGGVVGGLL